MFELLSPSESGMQLDIILICVLGELFTSPDQSLWRIEWIQVPKYLWLGAHKSLLYHACSIVLCADWHSCCLCVSSVSLSHGSWRVERSVRLRRESTWVKLSWRTASSIMVREGSPLKKLCCYLDFVGHGPWYSSSIIKYFRVLCKCEYSTMVSKCHSCNIWS